MKFTMTMEHVKLLNSMYARWDGDDKWGCPQIDSKRPYGDSDVIGSICQTVGWTQAGDDGEGPCWSSKQREAAFALHREMATALQILLVRGECVPGEYVKKEQYNSLSWTPRC